MFELNSGSVVIQAACFRLSTPRSSAASCARIAASSFASERQPAILRKLRSASSTPAAVQRRTVSPPRQSLTRRALPRTRLNKFSIRLVESNIRSRLSGSASRMMIRVSSSPLAQRGGSAEPARVSRGWRSPPCARPWHRRSRTAAYAPRPDRVRSGPRASRRTRRSFQGILGARGGRASCRPTQCRSRPAPRDREVHPVDHRREQFESAKLALHQRRELLCGSDHKPLADRALAHPVDPKFWRHWLQRARVKPARDPQYLCSTARKSSGSRGRHDLKPGNSRRPQPRRRSADLLEIASALR